MLGVVSAARDNTLPGTFNAYGRERDVRIIHGQLTDDQFFRPSWTTPGLFPRIHVGVSMSTRSLESLLSGTCLLSYGRTQDQILRKEIETEGETRRTTRTRIERNRKRERETEREGERQDESENLSDAKGRRKGRERGIRFWNRAVASARVQRGIRPDAPRGIINQNIYARGRASVRVETPSPRDTPSYRLSDVTTYFRHSRGPFFLHA